jgi:hypothetical protein
VNVADADGGYHAFCTNFADFSVGALAAVTAAGIPAKGATSQRNPCRVRRPDRHAGVEL